MLSFIVGFHWIVSRFYYWWHTSNVEDNCEDIFKNKLTKTLVAIENALSPEDAREKDVQFDNCQEVVEPLIISERIVKDACIPLIHVDVSQVYGYNRFPFLSDPDTVNFIKRSHTMFIMRGLPGSGKSMLVKCLQQMYPEAVVCSADHFFTDDAGNYHYDHTKIADAHSACQQKARDLCEKGTPVIIVDNTNIQIWTMSHYMRLSQSIYFYHTIIVEPLTPWRYDVDELVWRNIHGCDRDYIASKVQILRDNVYTPLYYGWFLSREDSKMLSSMASVVLQKCVDELQTEGTDIFQELLHAINTDFSEPKSMLHCTANYMARRKKDSYHSQVNVLQAMGRKFTLEVTGFVYSHRAISARINLNTVQENEVGINNTLLDLYVKDEEEILRERYVDVNKGSSDYLVKQASFAHGCSAHVTIAFARNGQSKDSGDDILNILTHKFYGSIHENFISHGSVSLYGGNMFHVKLHKPFNVDCLFHGFYSFR